MNTRINLVVGYAKINNKNGILQRFQTNHKSFTFLMEIFIEMVTRWWDRNTLSNEQRDKCTPPVTYTVDAI